MTQDLDRRYLLAGGLALFAGPAMAQDQSAAPPAAVTPSAAAPPMAASPPTAAPGKPAMPPLPSPQSGLVRVALKTSRGVITIDLNVGRAPITARNFLHYVDLKSFDDISFYRASRIKGAELTGVIQGGLGKHTDRLLKPIAHESTTKTGLAHKDGTISMGRRAPGTAAADFFICVGDQPYLDADPKAKGDNLGFAAFGQVVGGMDLVHTILALPTSPTAGVGAMRGEMLSPPVPILTVRRVTRTA